MISLFEGAVLFVAGSTNVLWVSYVTYIAFSLSYRILITIARYFLNRDIEFSLVLTLFLSYLYSSEVAKGLKRESYGLIFGFNTFLALLFQSVLTIAVSDGAGLALNPQSQANIQHVFKISIHRFISFVFLKKNDFSSRYTEGTMEF